MNAHDISDHIEAAKAYEALFVPALFGQWVSTVVDAVQVAGGQQVLDVACGTGILAKAALSRVGEGGAVVGLDPNPGMLAVAGAASPAIDWREGRAERLPFPNEIFDRVLCQFGLMFFEDRQRAVEEMLRVLRPGGCLAVAVWDAIENIPGYAAELALVEAIAGKVAGDAIRAPFVLGRSHDLRALLEAGGARRIAIETHSGEARFASIETMVAAELRGWLPVMGVHLADDLINQILREAESALGEFAAGNGAVRFGITAHIATAFKG